MNRDRLRKVGENYSPAVVGKNYLFLNSSFALEFFDMMHYVVCILLNSVIPKGLCMEYVDFFSSFFVHRKLNL